MKTINIARDFSKYPGGRYRTDGEWSGERFRDDVLVPALEQGKVLIEMDGTLGYGSSFLEECFGGLVRVHGFDGYGVLTQLVIVTSNPRLYATIGEYITDAHHVKFQGRDDVTDCLIYAWAAQNMKQHPVGEAGKPE